MISLRHTALGLALSLAFAGQALAVTTIPFGHSMEGELGKEVDSLAQRFNAANPDYKIVPVYKGNLRQGFTEFLYHQVAKQEDPAKQKPEQRGCKTLWIGAIAKGHDNQQHHDKTNQVIHTVNGDKRHHCVGSCILCSARHSMMSRRMLASRLSRRVYE